MRTALPGFKLKKAIAPAGILIVAGALWVAYGKGYVGYDGFYSLLWGSDIAQGRMPQFDAPIAPTPHPLANLAGVLLAPLGADAPAAYQALITLSFAALAWAAFQLGRRLFSWLVGLLFAAILLTRPVLVGGMLYASTDIPFLALVVGAAALEVAKPKRGAPVLVLLGIAGLLRPEGWLLSLAYVAYLLPGRTLRQRLTLIAAAGAAPLVWLATDVAVTGDPLHSLHGTREMAEQLNRPRSVTAAPQSMWAYFGQTLEAPVAWLGVGGALAALLVFTRRAKVPLALMVIGLLAFLGLGLAGLPVIMRYLLLPSAMVALFSAVAVFGWRSLPKGSRLKYAWMPAAAVFGVTLIASIPETTHGVRDTLAWVGPRRDYQRDLRELTTAPTARVWYRDCAPVYVPNRRLIPSLAFWLKKRPTSVMSAQVQRPGIGLYVGPSTVNVYSDFLTYPHTPKRRTLQTPRDFRRLARNNSWSLYGSCRLLEASRSAGPGSEDASPTASENGPPKRGMQRGTTG